MKVQPENAPNGSDSDNVINEEVPLSEIPKVDSTTEATSSSPKKLDLSITRRLVIYAIFTISIMIITTTSLIIFQLNTTAPKTNVTEEHPNNLTNTYDRENFKLTNHLMFTKSQWGGRPPLNFTRTLRHPTEYVLISHTGGKFCSSFEECVPMLQVLQSWHVTSLKSPDIGYNFLIGGDGNIYVGRGWDIINFHRDNNIGISFMGNYAFDSLTSRMISSLKELLDLGVKLNKLPPDYKLICHNQTSETLSPGENVFKEIIKFPHYYPGRVQIQ